MASMRRRTVLGAGLASLAAPAGAAAFPATDALLGRLVDEGRVAGAGIRIARGGKVLYRRSVGMADVASGRKLEEDALYRAYSMTKPVAAAAMMMLVEDGRADLDAPIGKLIPELARLKVLDAPDGPLDAAHPAATPVTLRHILTHTAGFTNNWSPGPVAKLYTSLGLMGGSWFRGEQVRSLDEFAARLGRAPLVFEPGSRWLYSLAFDLCGLVVQRAVGQTFEAYLKRRLFDPLSMVDSGFLAADAGRLTSVYARDGAGLKLQEAAAGSPFLTPPHAAAGASGLVTTLEDYGRFADALAGGGARGRVRVLSKAGVAAITSPQVSPAVLAGALVRFAGSGAGAAGDGLGFGLGGSVVVDPKATRPPGRVGDYSWGGAASTTFFASPALGLSAVLMTQLFPSGAYPLHDWLKTVVFADLGLGRDA